MSAPARTAGSTPSLPAAGDLPAAASGQLAGAGGQGSPGSLAGVLAGWAARPGRGVVFDFNGTLSDDEPLLLAVFTELFAEHAGWRLTAEDYYGRLVGLSDREIIATALAVPPDAPAVERLLGLRGQRYRALAAATCPVGEGARALLRRLAAQRVPVAVVTGAQRADVEFVLARAGVAGCVEVLVTEEDVTRGKPDPQGYLLGAARLGLDPSDLVAFEDSAVGVRAAKAAGMACVAVAPRGAAPPEGADAVTEALSPALLDLLPGPVGPPAAG